MHLVEASIVHYIGAHFDNSKGLKTVRKKVPVIDLVPERQDCKVAGRSRSFWS